MAKTSYRDLKSDSIAEVVECLRDIIEKRREDVSEFTALISNIQKFNNDGSLAIVSLADADAVNNSLYFSTTQAKLVYKDNNGVINNLY